jgi:hypothetical protein
MRRNKTALQCLIETDDFEIVNSVPGTWYLNWDRGTKSYRAVTNIRTEDGKVNVLKMHRLIMGIPDGLSIDHINHNLLDNRRSNLRLATNAENMQNRITTNTRNKTGLMNVNWNNRDKKWKGVVIENGNRHYCSSDYKSVIEKKVRMLRKKHLPFSQEALPVKNNSHLST